MRALWSDRPNCSHNVSQKVKRIRRFSDLWPWETLRLGDSLGSLRRVSGKCLKSVFGVFQDFLETFWGPGAGGPGRHL